MDKATLVKDSIVRVVLKDTGEIYEGVYCGGGENRLEINNVIDQRKQHLVGVYSFYYHEIEKIQVKTTPIKEKEITENDSNGSVDDRLYRFKFCTAEVERLKEIADDAILISSSGETYRKAVDALKTSESVGLVVLGIDDTVSQMKLLVLANRYKIFIFDTSKFSKDKFPQQLVHLLQSPNIVKVVHGEALITKCLKEYGITLNNVYDTQKWDSVIYRRNTETKTEVCRKISEALYDVLNIPESVLYRAVETNKHIEKWSERPLRDTRRLSAALLCAFLTSLKDGLEYESYREICESTKAVYEHYSNLDHMNYLKMIFQKKCHKEIIDLIT